LGALRARRSAPLARGPPGGHRPAPGHGSGLLLRAGAPAMVTWGLFIGLLGLERLFELWLSRRNARALAARGAVEVGREQFKWMSLLHGAFLVSCLLEVWLLQRAFPGAL